MDRKTLIAVIVCLALFMAYPLILRWTGLDRYVRPASQPLSGARGTPGAAIDSTRAPSQTGAADTMGATPPPAAPAPATALQTPERRIEVETPLYHATFSTQGARLLDVELKSYASAHGPVHRQHLRRPKPGESWPKADRVRLDGDPTFAVDLGFGPTRRRLDQAAYDVAESLDAAGQVRTLRFTRVVEGATIRQTYHVRPDDYAIDLDVEIRDVPLDWRVDEYTLTTRSWTLAHENDPLDEERSLKATSLVGTNLHHDLLGALRKAPKVFDGSVAWTAVQTRYFAAAVAILRGSPKSAVATAETRAWTEEERAHLVPQAKPERETVANSMVVSLPGGSEPTNRFLLYFGPNEYFRIARLGYNLERLVDLGWSWIRPLSKLLLQLLIWLHGVVRNYGIAILLLATLVRLLLHPLGMMSIKSMRAMQRVQPEIERIREKYKKDAQAMNTAVMALYKEHRINPAGGCLPMLVQMPLFVALYSVLFNAIELRQAPFVAWMQDLSAPDTLFSVGPFPIRLMPIIMALSGFLQQRMTPTDPRQASTFYLMNVMMLVFFYNLPSGLVLYWTVMNLLTALQQWLALREDGGVAPVPSKVTGRAGSK